MRSVGVEGARLLVRAVASDWACMTPEARNVFAQELMALANGVVKVHRASDLRAEFEAWHLRRKDDADYVSSTDKGRAWLAVSELAGQVDGVRGDAVDTARPAGPGESDCSMCKGRGFYGIPGHRCEFCRGTGKVKFWRPAPDANDAGGSRK